MKRFVVVGTVLVTIAGFLMYGDRVSNNYQFAVYKYEANNIKILIGKLGVGNLVAIYFPSELWIKTSEGRGEWRIDKLKELQNRYGNKWLNDSLKETLANGLLKSYDDLPLAQKFLLYLAERNYRSEKIIARDKGYLSKKMAPDGEEIWFLSDKWFENKNKYFWDKEIASVSIDVEVINASEYLGLANLAADSIEHAGARVVDVSKGENIKAKCEIRIPVEIKESNSLVNWLNDRFGCKVKNDSSEVNVVLEVGNEWGEKVKDYL